MNIFKNMKVRTKLVSGFSIVIMLLFLLVMFNLYELNSIENLSDRVVKLRIPTADDSATIKMGIHHALSGLRQRVRLHRRGEPPGRGHVQRLRGNDEERPDLRNAGNRRGKHGRRRKRG